MRFFKRQAVLPSRAKQRHDWDPPPVLEECGGRDSSCSKSAAQVQSRRVARGPRKSIMIPKLLLLLLDIPG